MKNLSHIKGFLPQLVLIFMFANMRITSGQEVKDQTLPIPDTINKIFQASCVKCHSNNGGILPQTKLNFSKWAEYGAAVEAEKASKICSELTNELMPPKSARKSNPELIPTKEQIELICKWAESLKIKKEAK